MRGISPSAQDKWLIKKPKTPGRKSAGKATIEQLQARIIELEEIMLDKKDYFAPRNRAADLAKEHGYTMAEMRSPRRDFAIVKVRHKAMRTIREEFPGLSWPQIGKIFNRDHSTVFYACLESRRRAERLRYLKKRNKKAESSR